MVRVQSDERLVDRRGVIVAKLGEVELTKITVDLVGVTAVTVLGKVLVNDLGAAEIRETKADDAERIGHAMLVILIENVVKIVADQISMIEHRHVFVQCLFVELLLV